MKKSCTEDFIRDYEKIRSVLRDIFVYGCFNRQDFKKRNISLRKYDNEKRKITTFLKSQYILEETENRRKYVRLHSNMFHVTENYLIDSYAIKSFTNLNVELYIKIMQVLALKPKLAKNQIMNELYLLPAEYKRLYDQNTVARKLEKLCKFGLLNSAREGNADIFFIADDPFESLSINEIFELYRAVQYYANVLYPSTLGYHMQIVLRQYAESERNVKIEDDDLFMFKHNHFEQVLDEEVMWELLQAMDNKQIVAFKYQPFGKDWRLNDDIIPVKIIVDEYYGRRWLFGIKNSDLMPKIFRLDRIQEVRLALKNHDRDDSVLQAIYDESMKYSWCACSKNPDKDLTLVELIFHLNDKNMSIILGRIYREKKWGTIEKIDEYKYRYRIEVTDPVEMKPWIRSFGGSVEVVGNSKHTLKEDLEAEWGECKKYYDSVQ